MKKKKIQNKLNDLNGAQWKYSTMTVIDKIFPIDLQHKLRSIHGGQKPPKLCAQIISYFTKTKDIVLDPFAGVGGTLIGSALIDRRAIGIEINRDWKYIYEEVCKRENLKEETFIVGDSNNILEKITEKIDFILTDVPYWNMDKLKSSRSKKIKKTKLNEFNNKNQTLKEWLEETTEILKKSINLLKNNKYLAVFIGDLYRDKNYYPLSSFLIQKLIAIPEIKMKSDIIWVDKSKTLHIFGYPSSYVPSIIHQHILIFKKEK